MYLGGAIHDTPRHWRHLLSAAEFWYNSSHHASLNCSPFKALYGHEPNLGAMLGWKDSNAATEDMDWLMHTASLHAQLNRAQARIKKHADRNRIERDFAVGDRVLLNSGQ
jgi:hypothetical protein